MAKDKDKKESALNVTKGVEQPASINKDAVRRFKSLKRSQYTAEQYVEGILNRDRTVLGQAITLIESSLEEHNIKAREIIEKCLPYSGNSKRIGITGVPGVGKSTFIESLGMKIINSGHKLAVLAVDPTSERSGGSILGDKTRMEKLSGETNAFIRPSPSGDSLGGVARKTRETVILCEAAGYDTIFIETVGVGQSETSVHSMVDFFLLLMLAGAGDELQGIKRGIMEMADAIAITKADGDNIEKSKLAKHQYENALHLLPPKESEWTPKVLTCSALHYEGIDEIWEVIFQYINYIRKNGYFEKKRNQQAKYWMYETIEMILKDNFYKDRKVKDRVKQLEEEVLNGKISSFYAARQLLDIYYNR
ncbi:MAG: methylmalonyl Co-A mutase-associated GTPase MeaB [Bacteroidales bacterium]